MAEQDILQSVYPYIGGQENVSRTIPRKGTLYLMLKDAGVVNLAAVNQVQGVISAELERGRLTLQLEGKEPEQMEKAVAECSVFGRVTPQQKKEMVLNWQKKFLNWSVAKKMLFL